MLWLQSFRFTKQITDLHFLNTFFALLQLDMPPTVDATREELHELGIFVHDYELYTASQMNYLMPILKYMPRYAMGDEVVVFAA